MARRAGRVVALVAALVLCAVPVATQEDEEDSQTSQLLLYKKMDPMEGFAVGEPINVTLSVFNKGLGNAYSIVVNDDNWKSDKFIIISGGNNFTLDYLNAGDQYVHEFMVVPIKKTWHRVRAAKMAFIDGVEGENTSAHRSRPRACARAERAPLIRSPLPPRLSRRSHAHVEYAARLPRGPDEGQQVGGAPALPRAHRHPQHRPDQGGLVVRGRHPARLHRPAGYARCQGAR